ncbi:MAG TPA: phosphoenolpyruvate carboxylase [Steroidobacteraceae bacterium]|nr:phosphoenolpyruvate carboxylase [Steroidobacteraceae bacterium]
MPRQEIHFPLKDTALRDDVHMLGALVGDVLKEQGGDALFDAVEGDRQAALARRGGDADAGVQLTLRTRDRSGSEARDLVRAFSTWFQMVNMAEKVHRIRRRRQYLDDSNTPQPGGIVDALQKLHAQGLQLDDIRRLMQEIWIEPVFTAHPTESTRRTILRKQQVISELLLDRLDMPVNSNESRTNLERIRAEITTGWQTADNSRERLTIADEREHVLFFVVEIIYKVIPFFYEEIEAALEKIYGPAAQDIEVPEIIRFGSWVGGDMDANPELNAKNIRETVARHQRLIINSYYLECQQLSELLSQSASRVNISAELQARIEQYSVLLSNHHTITPARQDFMPYRVFLGQVMARLRATYDSLQNHYENAAELLHDVQLVAASLRQNKGQHAGLFNVRRLMRRIRTFGFYLVTLDIRQHADVHREVIAHGLNDEQWMQRSSAERTRRLCEVIAGDQGIANMLDPNGKRATWVFETIAHCRHRNGPDAIGPFVVSGAKGADDVLSVLLLARWADTVDRRTGDVAVDVAPLFETVEELESCGAVMSALFNTKAYQRHLIGRRNHQFVMLGYSASNKESGVMSSHWLLRRAQEALVKVAQEAKVDLTIFHGRGSTSIRNAGMVETLMRTLPEGAVRSHVRLTEQGELINDKYSLRPITLRVLEQAFNALAMSHAGVRVPEQVKPEWRAAMDDMAAAGNEAYRALVYNNEKFYEFFRLVTPVDVIEGMQIGSHAKHRPLPTDLATTRAIPWGYAWAQSRYMLPSWFGVGTALRKARERIGDEILSAMYGNWYFFQTLIDQVEMGLARADLDIAQYYDTLAGSGYADIQQIIRDEFALAKEHVLRLKGCAFLLDAEPTMQRAIRLRNPYLDPLHLMQVDLLARWRATGRQDRELHQTLLASINGIGQGLQGST